MTEQSSDHLIDLTESENKKQSSKEEEKEEKETKETFPLLKNKNNYMEAPKLAKERYNHLEREIFWQNFWDEKHIYEFDSDSPKTLYSIDTPPPTISGALHLGHVYSYVQAEIITRFKRMAGFNVRYPIGMDNNGLPTEKLTEKEKGVKGQEMSSHDFIDICLEITKKYQKEYKQLLRSIGLSVDWRLEYSTISPEVQKLSQSAFIDLFKRGLIYKKNAPVLYCTECQTPFAQAEKEDKEKESIFYDIVFKLEDGEELIIATTRPELLPACVAVFVNPNNERSRQLIGKKVTTPLGETVNIIADEKVDIEKGSGVVMCCTYGDETDVYWAKKHNLPEKIIIGKDGRFRSTSLFDKIEGCNVDESRRIVIEELKRANAIRAERVIKHNVGVHERCGTPVEFLSTAQWFVKLLDMKEKLLVAGNKINWYPSYMEKRFEEWVNGLKWDWCISRERFYGIPIPVFNCTHCDYVDVPEEKELPVDPNLSKEDKICPHCKIGRLVPEKSVLDTWFTSALTPEINNQSQYNGRLRNKIFPMSMRPQGHDIIRTWALYSILMSLYGNNNAVPWNDLMISGHILVRKGEKISKKTGGGKYKPAELIKEKSADAVRYAMSGVTLGGDGYFEEQEVEKGRKLVTKIYNAGRFVLSNLIDFDPNIKISINELEAADRWIVGRSLEISEVMAKYFNEYDFTHARISFEGFFWSEYCDNYLEMVKNRLHATASEADFKKRKSAQYACYHSFLNILKMASPFVPHITEEMFHASIKKEETEKDDKKFTMQCDTENGYFTNSEKIKSIHTSNWPQKKEEMADENTINGAKLCLFVISEARKFKAAQGIKLNQIKPLATIICDREKEKALQPFLSDISSVIRVEKIEIKNQEETKGLGDIVVKIII